MSIIALTPEEEKVAVHKTMVTMTYFMNEAGLVIPKAYVTEEVYTIIKSIIENT